MAQDPRGEGEMKPRAQVELEQEGIEQNTKMCMDLKERTGWLAGGWQVFRINFLFTYKLGVSLNAENEGTRVVWVWIN